MPRRSCDIFCAVIDNFGDIGVCWRLARQLAAEYGWAVRLWVDDLRVFAHLCPMLDPLAKRQTLEGIAIAHWPRSAQTALKHTAPADIVIEAFGCGLPEAYLKAMAQRRVRPVWINLEYLSAEAWVADFHLQPSPHPRLALLKTFFFPGLTPGTGGVLQERTLKHARRDFLNARDGAGPQGLWTALGIAPPPGDAVRVSLFAYENPALPALLGAWRDGADAVVCIVPEGRISNGVARFLGRPACAAGSSVQIGQLALHAVPFMESALYDRLLWACDLNFVRGEDSFVRAQWAERPMVWHIYPQAGDAHLPKLDAALACCGAGLAKAACDAQTAFWHAWNAGDPATLDWPGYWRHKDVGRHNWLNWGTSPGIWRNSPKVG
jgi:uncharacterized repeat protein (TIGR03837 family)